MKEVCDVGRWKLNRQKCSISPVKEACDVGRWKLKRQKSSISPSLLPHEIIENMILPRLPVKDLLRFRVVCKQWEATISDPTFAEIHLQHNKNPPSRNLLAWESVPGSTKLHVAELRNNSIEFLWAIGHSREYDRAEFSWCTCDGLYLEYLPPRPGEVQKGKPVKCVLWNPSRRTYRELCCPPAVDVLRGTRPVRAVYYDSLMKDYKIVIADMDHYAVYSCRDNKWGDVKEMKGFLGDYCPDSGVFVNGSIYWVVMDLLDDGDEFREVICFDCKDESFKRLPLPNLEDFDRYHFKLTSFGGQLCLLISDFELESESYRLKIMKKVTSADGNDEWMESEECLCEFRSGVLPEPICQVSENEFLFHVRKGGEMVYMVYDKSKNTVVEIHNNLWTSFLTPVAHLENFLLL